MGPGGRKKPGREQGAPLNSFYSSPTPCLPLLSAPLSTCFPPPLFPARLPCASPPTVLQACALDPILDDSVMFARRLRSLCKPVTLRVVEDLPHGFLSLGSLCQETRQAVALCVERIHEILTPPDTAAGV